MPFMCWPQDTAESLFDHMNLSNHSRFADISRYRIFSESGVLNLMMKEKMGWLIAEQTITYAKPIRMFQRFDVVTTVKVEGDKWVYFRHLFRDSASGTDLANIEAKAVLKRMDGKTVKPSELVTISPYLKEFLSSSL